MDTSSGGIGASAPSHHDPSHHEPVPEPALMEVVISSDGVQAETVEMPSCHNCTVLQKELEDSKRDRAFFVDIKRKMILTDTLIQKHQSKCQAFEEQQKSIQNLTTRLAQSKRDCKVLEEQLATTLKDIIPWKKDKERFLQEAQESKKQFDDLHNKLSAQKSLIKQYESKLEICDDEKAVLESDIFELKSQIESTKQSCKKVSSSLEKAREDNGKLRKEMSQVKKSKASLNLKFERAKVKIRELCSLLTRHGIKAPRMRQFSSSEKEDEEEENEYMEGSESSDRDDKEDVKVSKATNPRNAAVKPVAVPTYQPYQPGVQSHPTSAPPSRRAFPRMDFTSVACLSPLPPSPPDNREDKYSSDSNESDTTLAEVAAKIEAQLATPVLMKRQTEQLNQEQSRPSTRISPRRRVPGRREATSSGAAVDPGGNTDGSASRRGLRSLRNTPGSSDVSCKPPIRSGFRGSKRLEMGETVESIPEKKRPRGRPRKIKDNTSEVHSDTEQKHRGDFSERLQGKCQSLSSSDEEVDGKEDVGKGSRMERGGISAMKTRAKAKSQDLSGQNTSEDGKDITLDDDLHLSSDESKHSVYNPKDSASSDGSDTESVIGRKKRLNMKRQTLRKSSALSDSSDSEGDHPKLKGTQLRQSVKPTGIHHPSNAVKHLSDESVQSSNMTLADEEDTSINTRRTSRRLAHRQSNVKSQASIEEQDSVKEHVITKCNKDLSDPNDKGIKTEHSKNMIESQRKVATSDREQVLDDQSSETVSRVLAKQRVTRQVSRKLLRSVSSPPGSEDDKGGGQFVRKRGRGISKADRSMSNKSSKDDGIPSKLGQENDGEGVSSQEKMLLRNLSSPARLTRSASRNLDSSESLVPMSVKTCTEQNTPSSVKADCKLPAEDEESSKGSKVTAKETQRSQKRSHDLQSSEDEKVDETAKSLDPAVLESRKDRDSASKAGEESEDPSARSDGKILMRSETEEFVACMDEVPFIDCGENRETLKTTGEGMVGDKGKTITSDSKDTKKRKLPTRQSKRIKLSSVDVIKEKTEDPSCVDGIPDNAGGDNSRESALREMRNREELDRPSTSRGLRLSVEVSHGALVREQPPILISQQRERHTSFASLPSLERNSPMSPIQEPFQGFDTRPISPMSPERPVERVSPILPTFFFDLPSIPRMLSPLPPSPSRIHPDAPEGDMQDVMSEEIPEAQAQPRMISPLFPTPVPFAVSPIPEMSVPPAISPIADVQHPPEISPIADVQPPVLGVQAIQNISPGKSPQLPSPRIFHSVAPSDAITVRPQHSSPSYNQDKTTAIRSLNAVLDRDDNVGDDRSSFSKKLIARRSSAEEPGRRPGDTSQNNPPSHPEVKNEARATANCNLPLNYSQRICAKHEPTKQPRISTLEQMANETLVKQRQSVTLRQSSSSDLGHQPPLQSKGGFSEYLRRADGHEDPTAFSRVIPHREEHRSASIGNSSTQPSQSEDAKKSCNSITDGKTQVAIDDMKEGKLDKGKSPSDATEPAAFDKPISKKLKKTIVGSIWGQMAIQDRRDTGNQNRKKQTRCPLPNSQESGETQAKFKVPSEPPLPATLAQQSVQVQGKDQAPRNKEQVFPGFVPASKQKPPVTAPLKVPVKTSGPGTGPEPVNHTQDLDKTSCSTTHAESSKSLVVTDQTPVQDVASEKVQAKASFKRPNQSWVPGPVTPHQIKTLKKLHLHDVLRLIREHSPKESVFTICECIIEFLEQNNVNLFPAIYAKCIVGNTSAQPVISSHEEQISKTVFLWTKEKRKRNVMHLLLSELGQRLASQEGVDLSRTLTFSRLFAAICRDSDWIGRARVLCYDIIRENLPNGYHLLLAIAAVWPSILKKKDGVVQPLMSTLEIIVMHQLHSDLKGTTSFIRETAEKIIKCFSHLCKWNPMAWESKGDAHAAWLIGLLKDPNIATFQRNNTKILLGNKCFETIKAVELLASCQGWEWTNNKLIIEKLWPVLKDWSKSLSKGSAEKKEDGTPGEGSLAGQSMTSLASACAVMKVIGNVGQIGLSINTQSVEQLLKMLIAVLKQPSETIPWPMQLYTAQSIYDLSPSQQEVASQVLRQWVAKAVNAVPEKLADRINNLGRKLQSPDNEGQRNVDEGQEDKESVSEEMK
ncbi:uncharacterized protein LOC121429501 [Lytechinus variegatus]|uniref:uncharacterized protein LOC121429501 n=1 Tax=Lytechinus variegatus TaxID=7654 RepID=UPI001BB17214|nr:uncharacterized protein LOC121429501 [Lytechinus variegatus]